MTKNNPDLLVIPSTSATIEIQSATLVDPVRGAAILDRVADHYFNNVELKQKRIMSDEQMGDTVLTVDALEDAFQGVITQRETIITNLYASTLKIRGAYVTD